MSGQRSLQFPWPTEGDHVGPAVRLFARDRLWIASLRRQVHRWRQRRHVRMPLVHQGGPLQLPVSDLSPRHLAVVEVARGELAQLADAIDVARDRSLAVVALLCRSSFTEPADRDAALELLREAGVKASISTPTQLSQLDDVLEWAASWRLPTAHDPLAELPLPCWSPAWQHGGGRIGLNNRR